MTRRPPTPSRLLRAAQLAVYGSVTTFGAAIFALIAFFGFVIVKSGLEPRPLRRDCTPQRHQAIQAHTEITQATSPETVTYSMERTHD